MIRLSPTSGLSLYKECPRCFWLHYRERVKRPRGIFPSLPTGMDLAIKKYFDQYRGKLPPELKNQVEGVLLEDIGLLNKWRDRRGGLEWYDKKVDASLFGLLDDCLIIKESDSSQGGLFSKDQLYIPLDYKTKGSAPPDGYGERYYQTQLDAYALLLEANGYKSADFAYLIFYYPNKVDKDGWIQFNIKPMKVQTNLKRAQALFEEAVNFLKGPAPKKHQGCEYCDWLIARANFE